MTWEDKVNAVKKIPIPTYMKEVIVPRLSGYYGSGEGTFEYRPVEKCPLHNEDTASFRYYEETNTCSCFGCRKGGSVINLHMYFFEMNEGIEVSKSAAVDWLYKRFISGENAGEVTGSQHKTAEEKKEEAERKEKYAKELKKDSVEEEISNVDILRSERKLKEAFERMRITDNTKLRNFRCVESADMIERLYRVGEISAKDAADYIELIANQQCN